MDRKEAIQVLQTALTAPFVYGAYANAINMAIEALSQPNYETDTEVRLVVTNREKEKVILWDAYGEVEYYPSVNVPTKCIAQININTDEVIKRIKNEYEIDNRPSAEWIMHIDDLYPEESTQECSNCHEHETIKIHNDDYCPSCGARMNKGIK